MYRFLLRHVWVVIIMLSGLFLVSAFFRSGWHTSHDGVYHILRTEEAWKMLRLGQFPLRWAGNLDNGFGIPLFTFIYPLPYYVSALLSIFTGSVWAVKIVMIAAYLLGGLGIYQLFKKQNNFLAATLALIYLMTPYQYINLFVRGALGEVVAMGIMPWAIVSFNQLKERSSHLNWYNPIPLALVFLAHNFLGILFGVFILGYLLISRITSVQLLSYLISLCLAAFFLIPMIQERSLLYSLDNQTFTFRYDQHFIALKQFIYGKWDYWYSLPGDNDGMSFQLGFAPIILSTLGILVLVLTFPLQLQNIYLIIAYLGSLFLMHSSSFVIWDNLTLLQTVQFPWRFLFLTSLLAPILGSFALLKLKNKKILYLSLSLLLVLSFWNVRNYRRPMKNLTASEYTDLYLLNLGKTTSTFRTEILPKWSDSTERYKTDELLVNSGNMIIDSLKVDAISLTTQINNKPDPNPAQVTILRNYYPGWTMLVDGKNKLPISPTSEGMIKFSPLQGVHTYKIIMTNTPIEKMSNLISLLALGTIGLLWQKNRHQK